MSSIAQRVGRETIDTVSRQFYAQIRVHPRLAPIFAVVHDWPQHEAHISHFWWTVLGGDAYLDNQYNVARKHLDIGVTPALVDEWLALFEPIVRQHVAAPDADEWLRKARMIGQSIALMNTPLD